MAKATHHPHIPHTHVWQKIPYLSYILLFLGFLGGIALRLTIFLEPLGQAKLEVIWYIGTIAYTIFYFFRMVIEQHRREICRDRSFFERLEKNQLSPEDVEYVTGVLKSMCRSKVQYNYVAWFGLTVVSLVGALLFV